MNTSTIDGWYNEFTKIMGKDFYMHSMRHALVTRFLRAGIPSEVVKDILGWSDISLVSVYSDLDEEESFSKYFGAEGIKKVETKNLNEL